MTVPSPTTEKRGAMALFAALASLAVVLGLSVSFSGTALAANNVSDDATVTINVTAKTLVDIAPNSLEWSGSTTGSIEPGTQGANKQVQIENIGSRNITKIWFNTSQPANRPFATGSSDQYDSGNYITIDRDNTAKSFPTSPLGQTRFVDRREFNETRTLVYLTDPSGNSPPDESAYAYGRFRNASNEYFWMIGDHSTDDTCQGLQLHVGNQPRTQTQTGTVDFNSGSIQSVTMNPADDSNHCYADFTLGNSGPGYLAVLDNRTLSSGQVQLEWTRWNIDAPGAAASSNVAYFYSSATDPLDPGDSVAADVRPRVPFGVAQGQSQQGTLTVIASDQ